MFETSGSRSPVAPSSTPRFFTDSSGTAWTIYEIQPADVVGGANLFLPHPERRGGWLLFESEHGERRRLAPFPPDWRNVSTYEIERWCMRATPVVAKENRRSTD
jgi:hypothetical protein